MSIDITKFFYNLIPGFIFGVFWITNSKIFSIYIEKIKEIGQNEIYLSIIFIIFIFSIGIILHGIWRSLKWIVIQIFPSLRNKYNETYKNNTFLSAIEKRKLPEFFSSRSALWGSMIIGILISWLILKINLCSGNQYLIFLMIFIILYFIDQSKENGTINNTINQIDKIKEYK